jgi:pimeloyl-ACP methyl ester carboxylesterase
VRRAVVIAGVVGATLAIVLKWLTKPDQGALPPGRIKEVDGEWIHYLDEGSGPPIVLIHGFTGSTFTWRNTMPALAATHRVVAFDLPGFGFSDRNPDLEYTPEAHARRVVRLMDTLGIDRATVVGHSMGGGVAERVAVEHPERVEQLVLVASVDASARPDWERRPEAMLRVALLGAALVFRSPWLARRSVRTVVGAMAPDEYASDEVVDGYLAPLLRPGTVQCVKLLFEETREMPCVDVGAIKAPTLVISGELDREVPARVGDALASKIPGARHVVQPLSGHLLAEEKPELFLKALLAFLSEPATV